MTNNAHHRLYGVFILAKAVLVLSLILGLATGTAMIWELFGPPTEPLYGKLASTAFLFFVAAMCFVVIADVEGWNR